MGVYVFKSIRAPWFKLGHHKISATRPNVYYRVAGRGFFSCVAPSALGRALTVDDFELVAWYPTLTRRDEGALHRNRRESVGEFHPIDELNATLVECDARGERAHVSLDDRNAALEWAKRSGGRRLQEQTTRSVRRAPTKNPLRTTRRGTPPQR